MEAARSLLTARMPTVNRHPIPHLIGDLRCKKPLVPKNGSRAFCRNGPKRAAHKMLLPPFSAILSRSNVPLGSVYPDAIQHVPAVDHAYVPWLEGRCHLGNCQTCRVPPAEPSSLYTSFRRFADFLVLTGFRFSTGGAQGSHLLKVLISSIAASQGKPRKDVYNDEGRAGGLPADLWKDRKTIGMIELYP